MVKEMENPFAYRAEVSGANFVDRAEFEHLRENLRNKIQRKLLLILARVPHSQLTSTEFIAKWCLKSAAHVEKAMKGLEKKGIVENGKNNDIFFAERIRRLEE